MAQPKQFISHGAMQLIAGLATRPEEIRQVRRAELHLIGSGLPNPNLNRIEQQVAVFLWYLHRVMMD